MPTLEQLNAAGAGEFVALLDGVYEHSPWIAARAAARGRSRASPRSSSRWCARCARRAARRSSP